ncbi:AraC family transcriptional regulator [Pseudorhodoplanes sinuspersici]|uniref:AraC family transcriptional regulator n=1 Tax=Pseudorhodoplanes sinuspersici TaxID=1235591 RepID=A0A1W6ZSQ0_9HYPH|nr:helix-turn-helix transcriptional regulator [Pseudorhodoplanes sinuspersici]ARQ00382.1 AraC family transcriptional regulator [Pseudorhodoplanes sinuspersici]RKE67454.1 AraC family transcriptional regulator [Pseudorhodoplanes sinuspersici]
MAGPPESPFDADTEEERPLLIAVAHGEPDSLVAESHSHAYGQLAGAWRGLLTLGTETGQWVVPAVHAVWIPPHQVHSGRSHGPFDGWCVYIRPSICRDLPDRPVTMRTSGLLREAVLRMAQWKGQPLDDIRLPLAQVILNEIRTLPAESLGLPMPRDPRLLRIANALAEHPEDDRDLHAWASWAGVATRTLSRRFVSETGFTFTAWRQRARLLRSLEMLTENTPVTSVALDLGYDSISAFIALFRRTFGVTPGEYVRNATRVGNKQLF